jgi:transposase
MNQNDLFTGGDKRRWNTWMEGKDRGLSDEKIAEKLHCSRSTIKRLKNKAKRNGAYQEWVESVVNWTQEEFRELHETVKKKNPVKAYEQMGRIIERSMVRRVERKTDSKIEARVAQVELDLGSLSEDENINLTSIIGKIYGGRLGEERS